ncbi:hypothetical protein BDP27DRAFT_1441384 [Rhodocollybia butyracea]|uniref:RING-type E3 ubiquitin transferase n=1 Tax=Rhodocollybia butyracea TaxID=206335 RepID=A0A9P5Q469_9AGAR|nr:hypothetical protein BDP27DRAFT_1441384 [Rhodocollybia butyracea]
MDRPSTSKARGICKYYNTPRGCYAANHCKFLHGDPKLDQGTNSRLTPFDQAKTCRFFAKGFCKHGDKCWFLHIPPETGPQVDPVDETCAICLEKPSLYGLLTGCSHVFCIACLKQWRDPKLKTDLVYSGVHKKCPMCRSPSKYITPSSLFYKQDDPNKAKIVAAFKESMAKVPCRYFVKSKAKDKNKPFCQFGKDCFYQHLNDDGTPHILRDGIDASMRRASQYHEHRGMDDADDLLSDIMAGVSEGRVRNPFDVLGQFIQESNLNSFSTAFADLFQGLLVDNVPATPGLGPMSPVSRSRLAHVAAEGLPPTWSLDQPPSFDIRVSAPFVPDRVHVFPTSPDPSLPSAPTDHDTNHDDGYATDDSMPVLHSVSDSDESDDGWTDSELEAPNHNEPRSRSPTLFPSPPSPALSPEDDVSMTAPSTGRFPRVVFNSASGFSLQQSRSIYDPPNNEQFVRTTMEDDRNGELPSLEAVEDSSDEVLSDSKNPDDEELPPHATVDDSEEPCGTTLPPFTTDGRGRVIAASDDGSTGGERRSFLSRMFDVLF